MPLNNRKEARQSAGLLVYKRSGDELSVFLVHPGGPFWAGKDAGAWSLPKGEFTADEDPLAAARREFTEETGQTIEGRFVPLQPVRQKAGKIVHAWAVEGEVDADRIVSNSFRMEYPYKSGRWITVPEVDKAAWFAFEEAKQKINPAQALLLDQLKALLDEEAL